MSDLDRHTFGSANNQAEPEHLVKAREYKREREKLQGELDTKLRAMALRHQGERSALASEYDDRFRTLAREYGYH